MINLLLLVTESDGIAEQKCFVHIASKITEITTACNYLTIFNDIKFFFHPYIIFLCA